jgi:hypothetical protein
MTQNLEQTAQMPGRPLNRQTQLRADADRMLREIAFVLKMTQRVREEMDAEQEAEDLVLA